MRLSPALYVSLTATTTNTNLSIISILTGGASSFNTQTRTKTNTSVSNTIASSSQTMKAATKNLVVDPFCFRQFTEKEESKNYGGTTFSISIEEFENVINERYKEIDLIDGYAPFCKHLFLINDFTDGKVNVLPVKGNDHLIRTEYAARNEKEVPVLQRFISVEDIGGIEKLPKAKYLDLILYSREQIIKENASMCKNKNTKKADDSSHAAAEKKEETEAVPWGVVSIKCQNENFELPMNPITQMRNALGKEEGGSGIPLDRDAYMKSVQYWSTNVNVS